MPPQQTDPTATAGAQTGGTTAAGTKRKHHKNAVANSDSQPKTPVQSGPVTTGVEPAGCDANGDGVTDSEAPSSCTSDGTVSTGVEQGNVAPLPYSAPKKKAAPKKKVRRRASAR